MKYNFSLNYTSRWDYKYIINYSWTNCLHFRRFYLSSFSTLLGFFFHQALSLPPSPCPNFRLQLFPLLRGPPLFFLFLHHFLSGPVDRIAMKFFPAGWCLPSLACLLRWRLLDRSSAPFFSFIMMPSPSFLYFLSFFLFSPRLGTRW